ncbi:DUF4189 domain-containing protein [Williamsia sp.]|uniref:DUF4189 domain-containing protein n=1 Tax=Williamsia sp. TaxID=1872085 RepID=UPI002F91D226
MSSGRALVIVLLTIAMPAVIAAVIIAIVANADNDGDGKNPQMFSAGSSDPPTVSDPSGSPTGSNESGSESGASDQPSAGSTYTTAPTPAPILYGGIAYNGAGGATYRSGYTDGYLAKEEAVNECNQEIWSAGWPGDAYCGYVSLKTGECGSVAVGTLPSGWGPTGWSVASTRSQVVQAAIDQCVGVGQGECRELYTLCM